MRISTFELGLGKRKAVLAGQNGFENDLFFVPHLFTLSKFYLNSFLLNAKSIFLPLLQKSTRNTEPNFQF